MCVTMSAASACHLTCGNSVQHCLSKSMTAMGSSKKTSSTAHSNHMAYGSPVALESTVMLCLVCMCVCICVHNNLKVGTRVLLRWQVQDVV